MVKKRAKSAFTIAEAIITFGLMGIIFVVTISNTNIKFYENYNQLYWQAFNTLYQASKALNQQWEGEAAADIEAGCVIDVNAQDRYTSRCWRNSNAECIPCRQQEREFLGGTKNIDRDFPGFLFNHSINNALVGRGQDREFCLRLISKINTLPAGRCESFISMANPDVITNNNKTGGKNFLDAFTYAIEKDDGTYETVNSVGGIAPSFVALNGQKFYISSVVTANTPASIGPAWSSFAHESRESYRFVAVDLNGDAKPNSQFKTGSRNPDIVLFAIDSEGNVIPLGLPEFSESYINAIVYYPNDIDDSGSRVYQNVSSDSMILWNAKGFAWGNQLCGGTDSLPYISAVTEIEPLSKSSKFYAVATKCKDDVKACSNKETPAGTIYADELFVHLVMQFIYDKEGETSIYSNINSTECTEKTKNSKDNGCIAITSKDGMPTCGIDFKH